MGRTTKEIRKRIDYKEDKLGRELSKEEVRKITKSVKRKVNRENTVRGIFLALGITAGASGTLLLNAGKNEGIKTNNKEISVDLDEANKDLNVSTQDNREVFVNGIKVNIDSLDKSQQLEENVGKEIDALETSEDVLNYIKEIYANEYNDENKTNIETDDITLSKKRADQNLYKDIAINGDEIIRKSISKEDGVNYLDTETGVITAQVKNADKEVIFNNNGNYKTVYSKDEQVEKYENNILSTVGKVIDAGIDLQTAIDANENVPEVYKDRLKEAVEEYKNEKIEEMSKSGIQDESER